MEETGETAVHQEPLVPEGASSYLPHPSDDHVNTSESKFRSGAIVIFVLNCLSIIFLMFLITLSFIFHTDPSTPIMLFLFNTVGLGLLGNGLFGNSKRAGSLAVYVLVFEVFVAVVYGLIIFACLVGFGRFRTLVADQLYELHQRSLNPTTVLIVTIIMMVVLDIYHILAAWVISTYRKKKSSGTGDF